MRLLIVLMLSLVGCKEKYIDNDEYLPPIDKQFNIFDALEKPLIREGNPKQYDQ